MFTSTDQTPAIPRLRELYRYMEPRGFIAGRRELIDAGFASTCIASWRRSGRLITVLHGTYSFGRDIETRESAWRAGLVAAGSESALTGRSACELWGIVDSRPSIPEWIDVAVPQGDSRVLCGRSRSLRRTGVRVSRRELMPGDVHVKDGLRVVNAQLALIDLAIQASERDVRFAFLEACRLRHFRKKNVQFCLSRGAGRRGFKKLRPLLAQWVPELGRTRSVFEGMVVLAVSARGDLPLPLVNPTVEGYEVDLCWPGARLIVELDGRAFHSGQVQRRFDEAKSIALDARGWTVLRITFAEFDADQMAVLDGIAKILSSSGN